jgi:signal transduction histidine kinase
VISRQDGNGTKGGNKGRSRRQAGSAEQAAPSHFAAQDFADLAYAVTHEFNNALNNLLLQVAVIERSAQDPRLRCHLETMRQIGTGAATMIQRLQRVNRPQENERQTLDVNQIVLEVLAELGLSGSLPGGDRRKQSNGVALELGSGLPAVSSVAPDLLRLVRLLVRHARQLSPGGGVKVRTYVSRDSTALRVEDQGPQTSPEQLPHLFDPFSGVRGDPDDWLLTVSRSLCRRLQATIEAENLPEGGMAITVTLPAVSQSP